MPRYYTSRMRRLVIGLWLFVFALAACAQPAAKPVRILLVGNALITSGDVAARLGKVAQATGRTVRTEVIASPRYSLEDHADDASTLEAIRRGWDYVVLQQDASSPDKRAAFTAPVKRLSDAARAAGAKPVLFMAWPRHDRSAAFRDAIALHREAAQAADAMLVPAAEAWLRALGDTPDLKLYANDGTQATPLGSDLAALTLFFTLMPAGPQEFDEAYVQKIGRALDLPPAARDKLIDAATRAVDEPLALGKPRTP